MIMQTRRIQWQEGSERCKFIESTGYLGTGRVINDRGMRPFILGQVLVGLVFALSLTWLSMAIADHVGTPEVVRWIVSPGYVLGMRLAWGRGFWDQLRSFMLVALLVNLCYYGLALFLLLRRINWPKLPRNPRHHFWMEP